MSYTIEYERKIFQLSEGTTVKAGFGKTEHVRHENDYFLFIKEGCNNLDPRPQEWQFNAVGWNYQIISKICERAARTESGSLKLTSGDTSPEAYLRLYRKEIANAQEFSIAALRACTGIHEGYLCIGNKNLSEPWVDKKIKELKTYFSIAGSFYDFLRFNIPLTTEEQFLTLMEFSSIADQTGGYVGVNSFQNKNGF